MQYIHHLKENEARNIEKWTLEKLLMDQAMGDLQAQLEEVRRAWDEERAARQRLENEIAVLRGIHGTAPASGSPPRAEERTSPKRPLEEGEQQASESADERAKRPRTD